MQIDKHNLYLKKLQDKNIKIIPLEKYITAKENIKHRCICGNENWFPKPSKVLRGMKCGCTKRIKKTHDNYLEDLKSRNIKTEPLENYNGAAIKILHKCICGNEWKVSPNTVLSGQNCGCKVKGVNYNYEQKLIEKDISVMPLEPYIDSRTKILHKCTCGNEWMVTPNNVLAKKLCGCKKFDGLCDRNFYKNKLTVLYYFEIDGVYKIGITKNNIEYRYRSECDISKANVLLEHYFEDGAIAWDIESEIKKEQYNFLYEGDMIFKYTKNTEIFTKNIIKDIYEKINKYR